MLTQEKDILAEQHTALPIAQRGLAFAPHPDDEVFGCGGILALLHSQGCLVSVIVVTDGVAGGDNGAGDLARIRADESRSAAGILGLSVPTFWGLPDRGLAYGELLIERVKMAITEADADLVLLPSPTELHPDHQALALAGAEALRRLGGARRALFYEINLPLPSPNLMIDITSVFEQKRAAMACFPSQLEEQPYDRRIEGLNRFRSYFLGSQSVAAEAYVMVDAASIQPGLAPLFEGPLAHRRRLGFAVSGEDFPLVSVLIRSMDRPMLMEALDSVALQTWPNTEVVVVNARGGYHSPLPEQCGRFPLRLLNQGGEPLSRPRAANLALDSTRGQWLIFLDDDDLFVPEHLAGLVETVQSHPGTLAAYAGVGVVNAGGEVEEVFNFPYDRRRLVTANFLPVHAVLFSRHLATEYGARFDESFDVYEDWDFWMQLSRHTDFIHLPRVTAIYRPIGNSGAGVTSNERTVCHARSRFFGKWLRQWSADEVAEGLRYLEDEHRHHIRLAEQELARRDEELARRDEELARRAALLHEIAVSTSWRVTAPLRWCGRECIRLRQMMTPQMKMPLASRPMKRLGILAHYDRDNRIDPYVLHLLQALREQCTRLIFVTTSALPLEELKKATVLADRCITRENIGYDFFSWRVGLTDENPAAFDEVVLANDSCYGPLTSFTKFFGEMSRRDDLDFWGLTDSQEVAYHLQSYFLAFRKNVVESKTWAEFWQGVVVQPNKREVIRCYEVGLSQRLLAAGFRGGAVFRYRLTDWPKIILALWRNFRHAPWALLHRPLWAWIACNKTHYFWREILARGPGLIKVELLRDNPTNRDLHILPRLLAANPSLWQAVLKHQERMNGHFFEQIYKRSPILGQGAGDARP